MSGFEAFMPERRFQDLLALSPDGSQVAYSCDESGQFNLWRRPLDGGAPTRLTDYDDQTVYEAIWTPDGDTLIYTADRDGDEQMGIYSVPAAGGEPTAFTNAPSAQHMLGAVSPDGKFAAYGGNDVNPEAQDLIVRDLSTGTEAWRFSPDRDLYIPASYSPDGAWLLVVQFIGNTDLNLILVAVDGSERRTLTPHTGEQQNYPGPWAGDGSGFWYRTDAFGDHLALAFHDLAAGESRVVDAPDWDVEDVTYASEANLLVWTVNENGYSRLKARDLTTGADRALPDVPAGVIEHPSLTKDGRTLVCFLTTGGRPTDIAVVDLAGGTFRYLTDSAPAGLAAVTGGEPELVSYPTHDGREIPAFLYRPAGAGRLPVVLSIHGGPEYQERPHYMYSGFYSYLLSKGVAVLAPNVRGSTGYGSAYQRLIHHDWGGDELKDFEYAVRYLRGLDWVDPDRIAVFGGSFGGFATLSCVSRLPHLNWAAGVSIVGPSNLVTFARSVPPTWRAAVAELVGDPDTEADFLAERSPITYAEAIRAPLFVIQGANDGRVAKAESDQVVASLRERGVPVRYDVYDDEGHNSTRRASAIRERGTAADFLIEHLAR